MADISESDSNHHAFHNLKQYTRAGRSKAPLETVHQGGQIESTTQNSTPGQADRKAPLTTAHQGGRIKSTIQNSIPGWADRKHHSKQHIRADRSIAPFKTAQQDGQIESSWDRNHRRRWSSELNADPSIPWPVVGEKNYKKTTTQQQQQTSKNKNK